MSYSSLHSMPRITSKPEKLGNISEQTNVIPHVSSKDKGTYQFVPDVSLPLSFQGKDNAH